MGEWGWESEVPIPTFSFLELYLTFISHFLLQIWDDHYLQWNAEDYPGLDFLVMTSERIWMPDLYVQNSVGDTEAPLENYATETCQVHTMLFSDTFGLKILMFLFLRCYFLLLIIGDNNLHFYYILFIIRFEFCCFNLYF